MNEVVERRVVSAIVVGTFGHEGFRTLWDLLRERCDVRPTHFTGSNKTMPNDLAMFEVRTDLNNVGLRRLLTQVSGVKQIRFKEEHHA